jgi:hypothetical protein
MRDEIMPLGENIMRVILPLQLLQSGKVVPEEVACSNLMTYMGCQHVSR